MHRVDAHQHFWRVDRGDYGWMSPDDPILYRDFGPNDLIRCLAHERIDATVLVQAAPTVPETRFLLETAAATDFVQAVVGWVDLADPAVGETLDQLAKHPLFRGVRPMLQDLQDDDWMLRADVGRGVAALEERELAFDALVLPRHLPHLARLIDRHPGLRVVIDHGAKPPIRERDFEPWARDIARVARAPQVFCKLSGLTTEAGPGWLVEDLRPYVAHLVACFGAERLLWGSDWPVCLLAGGYRAWAEVSDALLAELSSGERAAVFGETARAFYRLPDPLSAGRPDPR